MRAGGQIHNRVRAPTQRPHHFFDFFGQAGGYGGIAQVAVDFDAEVAADNHRFEFGVVDVGGDNRTSGGDFLAHEFGRDLVGVGRDIRAETLPCVLFQELGVFRPSEKFVQLHAFAYGGKLHFGRDDAAARIVKLGYVAAAFRTARAGDLVETQMGGLRVVRAFDAVFAGKLGQDFGIAAFVQPCGADVRQTLFQVDVCRRIAVHAAGVIDGNRRVGFRALRRVGVVLTDFAQRHADVVAAALQIHALRVRIFEADADVFAQVGKLACFVAGSFGGFLWRSHKKCSCFLV